MQKRMWFVILTCLVTNGCTVDDDLDDVEADESAEVVQRRLPHSVDSVGGVIPKVQVTELVTGGCMLYQNTSYGGATMWIPYGYDYNDLHRINGFGDIVSSIQCDPNAGATMWSGSNFTGGGWYVAGDLPGLPSGGATGPYNDTISSVSWGALGSDYCTLFTDSNYSGSSITVYYGVDYNDLHRTSPAMGDNISSVFCSSSYIRPVVCKNDTWGGACMTLGGPGNYPNLGSLGYGDNISSLRW